MRIQEVYEQVKHDLDFLLKEKLKNKIAEELNDFMFNGNPSHYNDIDDLLNKVIETFYCDVIDEEETKEIEEWAKEQDSQYLEPTIYELSYYDKAKIFFDFRHEIVWNKLEETNWEYSYLESRRYVIRNVDTTEYYFVKASSPREALYKALKTNLGIK